MNKLNLTFKLSTFDNLLISIDDKIVFLKKDKYGKTYYTLNTDNNYVKVKITSINELESKFYFIILYLFFLISLLGIFDKRIDKRFLSIEYEADIKVNQNSTAEILLPNITKKDTKNVINEKIVTNSETEINVLKNICTTNEKLKKRFKLLKTFKIISWIVFIISIPVLFYFLILN